jgi:cytochrome P450
VGLFDAAFYRDPYPAYDKLRAACPVLKAEGAMGPLPTWIVTGYDAAIEAFTHPGISKDTRRFQHVLGQGNKPRNVNAAVAESMVATDPPDHTRLRRLVSKSFTASTVDTLRPRIQQITAAQLNAISPAGPVDLMETLAVPLPITVISELLGAPEADRDSVRRWSNDNITAGDHRVRDAASHQIAAYMTGLVAAKRANPDSGLLSDLVTTRDADDRLSETELVSLAVLLLIAGHETTTSLIGNAVLALLQHPDQLDRLRDDPALIPGAINELLRYDSPSSVATIRFTSETVTIAGVPIPADQVVLISPAAANRDPGRFTNPDALDLDRGDAGSHLAFGHGIHYCLGARLARAEAEIALMSLLSRFPDLRLAVASDDLEWRHSRLIHGLQSLPVSLCS